MRKIIVVLLLLVLGAAAPAASAYHGRVGCRRDNLNHAACAHKHRRIEALGYPRCPTWTCVKRVRRDQFKAWAPRPIADCTWVGESSPPGDYSGRFSMRRYTRPNASGSGAYGKFQMMPATYAHYARHGDWSPGDQEEAAHRLYYASGTGPWSACG